MRQIQFIQYGKLEETLAQLNRGVRSGGIVTLVGFEGVGKTRCLQHLLLHQQDIFTSDQLALVQMMRPKNSGFGKNRLTSPASLVLFSRLWHVIQKMSRLTYKEWLDSLDQKPAHLYTDPQFLALHANVAEAIDQRHIGVVVIDNAELLDDVAFAHVIQLWEDCDQQFTIILTARMQPNATPDEPLEDIWCRVNKHVKEYVTDQAVLDKMTEEQFQCEVLPLLLYELDADVAPGIGLTDRLWHRTQGNWHALTRLITFLTEALDLAPHKPRSITAATLEQVLSRK